MAVGLFNSLCTVSRSTCRLLGRCRVGVQHCFSGGRRKGRVTRSVRRHVTRLFSRLGVSNVRTVAVRRIRSVVGHVKGPRRVRSSSARAKTAGRGLASRAKGGSGGFFQGPRSGVLNNIVSNVTTCIKFSILPLHLTTIVLT